MLFDIPKNVVFAEILVFSNIFGFPAVNWAPKWNKTVNFGCLPFELKYKILKYFSNFVFPNTNWRPPLVKISAKLNNILGKKGQKNPRKGFMDAESIPKSLKNFNFTTTNAILMKLITNIHLKVFHLAKSWSVTHKVQEDINKKAHKMSQKDFWRNSDHFLILQ